MKYVIKQAFHKIRVFPEAWTEQLNSVSWSNKFTVKQGEF